mgnify:CR=1 FL=1|jgi:hypothetical protein
MRALPGTVRPHYFHLLISRCAQYTLHPFILTVHFAYISLQLARDRGQLSVQSVDACHINDTMSDRCPQPQRKGNMNPQSTRVMVEA